MIYICSQTNINLDEITLKPKEVICQISGCNEQQSTLSEYLKQFSNESQNYILNAKILCQGVELEIKSFCGKSWKNFFDENTICDILQNKEIELYEPLPYLGFYIERHFQSETLDLEKMKRKMLGWKSANSGFILFSENDKSVPGCEATFKIFENMQDVRAFVQEKHWEPQDTYYLCSYCDNEPKLLYSFGKSGTLTIKKTMAQDSLLNEKHTKIKIISDVAGMGKSTTLLALAERDKRNNPSHLIFFIELNKHLKRLKNAKDLSSTDDAINFLGENILNLKEVALRVFINACKQSGKVALYFDAFDEIASDAEKVLPSLLLNLERTEICRIYVSSRPNYMHVLEETVLQKSMQFLGLTDAEIECALEGFWKQLLIKESKKVADSILKDTARKIVHLLHKEERFLIDILAIPLQIRMLATIYYESIETRKTSELSTVKLCDLYEEFIRLHARRFYVDKTKMHWNDLKDEMKRRLMKDKLRGAEMVACQTIIPELLEYNEATMSSVLSSLCDDLGLITNKNPPVFLHRTIAEYLAAKYVLTKLYAFEEEDTLCRILTADRFNVVRRFINSLLVGNSLEFFLKKEIYQWRENEAGNNPLHVAALEGNVEIMNLLLRCDKTLLNVRNTHGEIAIHSACRNSKPEALKLLLMYYDCSVNEIDDHKQTTLHVVTDGGRIEKIEMILHHDKSLLNKKNDREKAPLHLACKDKNEDATKFPLESTDCLVNLCDDNGNTVLHIAAKSDFPEIIETILQHDRSLLNKKNERGKLPLHLACKRKNEAAAKFLLESPDCLVNLCDDKGNTVLHIAAANVSPVIIEMILRHDKSLLNKKNKRGKSPLHLACKRKNEAAAKFLLESPDCLVNLCDDKGNTVLHIAAANISPEIIEMILRRDKSLLNKKNEYGQEPLYRAFQAENEPAMKFLLEIPDCCVDLYDSEGDTVLHAAAVNYSPEIIAMILRHDKSLLNKQNKRGKAPLHEACAGKNEATAKFLLENSDCLVNFCDEDGDTVLHIAAKSNFTEIIEMILRRDKSLLNKKNKLGKAPLHFAYLLNNTKVLKYLLSLNECVLDTCDAAGNTVLHYISFVHKSSFCFPNTFHTFVTNDTMKIILQHENAPINKQSNDGETPLHRMIRTGKTDKAELLLTRTDCLVNICDKNNETALHAAVVRDNIELVKIILRRENVLINQQNSDGRTPLHLASSIVSRNRSKHSPQAVKLLIADPCCSIHMRDNNGLTALEIALINEWHEVIEILLQHDTKKGNRTVEEVKLYLHRLIANDLINLD